MNISGTSFGIRNKALLLLLALGLAACAGNTPDTGGGTVTSVTVSPGNLTLQVGQTEALTATVAGTGSHSTAVTWSSGDGSVATVDATGLVTAIAAGSTVITAASASTPTVQGTAQVTVSAGQEEACPEPGEPVDIPDDSLRNRLLDMLDAETVTECELARLELINVQNHGVETLEGLQYATNLAELDVALNRVTDLEPISDLNLEALKLGANPITDLTPISGMTSLRVLQLEWNAGVDNLDPLAALVNLERLLISDTEVTDLDVLEGFTKLNYLALGSYGSVPSDFSVITRLPELATLHVTMLPAEDLDMLQDIAKLTHLLLRTTAAYPDISDVLELTQLESLTMRLPVQTELDVLTGMTNLATLNVADSFVTDLEPLLLLTELESLDVRRNCLPEDLHLDPTFIELRDHRGVAISHLPQRTSGCPDS